MRTLDDIRRANLAVLVGAEGSQAAFARKVSKDKNQINQWLGRAGSRNISSSTAREIEKKAGKPPGWMDQDRSGDARGPPSSLASQSAGLDVARLANLLGTVEAAVETAGVRLSARVRARLVATLYADKEASAAASAQAVRAALVGILATMETSDEPDASR